MNTEAPTPDDQLILVATKTFLHCGTRFEVRLYRGNLVGLFQLFHDKDSLVAEGVLAEDSLVLEWVSGGDHGLLVRATEATNKLIRSVIARLRDEGRLTGTSNEETGMVP